MERVTRVRIIQGPSGGAVRVARWAASQPGWVLRAALIAFLVVVGVPLLILVGAATAAAAVVLLVLAAYGRLRARLARLRGRADGRRNVRVLTRDHADRFSPASASPAPPDPATRRGPVS